MGPKVYEFLVPLYLCCYIYLHCEFTIFIMIFRRRITTAAFDFKSQIESETERERERERERAGAAKGLYYISEKYLYSF